jgi:hypothetical protein
MMMPIMEPVFKEDPPEVGEGLSVVATVGKSVQVQSVSL